MIIMIVVFIMSVMSLTFEYRLFQMTVILISHDLFFIFHPAEYTAS
jgi:hypothetical protein